LTCEKDRFFSLTWAVLSSMQPGLKLSTADGGGEKGQLGKDYLIIAWLFLVIIAACNDNPAPLSMKLSTRISETKP
jgi:hypothetical protein